MLRSLGLVALMLLGLMFYARLGTPPHPAPSTDAAAVVQAARTVAPFPVLAATTLPKGWYANTAAFDPVPGESGHWRFHIGYTDGSTQYRGITASNATDASTLLPAPTSITTDPAIALAGLSFTRYQDDGSAGAQIWVARGLGHDGSAFVIRIDGGGSHGTSITRGFVASLDASGGVAVG